MWLLLNLIPSCASQGPCGVHLCEPASSHSPWRLVGSKSLLVLFCCVIVSMLNNMGDSLFPIFVHLWQTQLIAHLTAITAPSHFILAGETLLLF